VRAEVERQPVENLLVNHSCLSRCHDALIAGGFATRKTHPRDPPARVGRQWNGQRCRGATPLTGKSQPRFTADRFAVGNESALRAGQRSPDLRRNLATGRLADRHYSAESSLTDTVRCCPAFRPTLIGGAAGDCSSSLA
jgi:hypothetical protein